MKALYKIFFLFVLISLSICNDCPENCICEGEEGEEGREEEEEKVCSSCKSGYFGQNCEYSCEKCVECDREEGMCLECKDDSYWGPGCSAPCGKCLENSCNIEGECKINGTYCGDKHYWGIDCNNTCIREGYEHCDECKMDGGNCTQCEKGYYSVDCNGNCSNCPGRECSFNDGKCNDGEYCIDKKHKGDYCTEECNSHCKECLKSGECTL